MMSHARLPGANKVIAAADTAAAISTCMDPRGWGGKPPAATVTAVGSILAATDIPVVAQTGAVVSTVASVFTNDAARKAVSNAVKNPVGTAKNVAKKLKFW